MKTKYNISSLEVANENNTSLKYLYFWGHNKPKNQLVTKSCFSQWYESSFTINGTLYKTTEHWMMAQKALLFENHTIYKQIITCNTAAEAKKMGRQVSGFIEEKWKQHRNFIVIIGNLHKFNQNRLLGEYLLNTNNRILVEASPVNSIWGIGLAQDSQDIQNVYSWRGLNLLGFVLMEVHDLLRTLVFFNTSYTFTPPWVFTPEIHPNDLFWKQYNALNDRDQYIYKLCFPEPPVWTSFYN